MTSKKKAELPYHIFWFRRDLRLNDNIGLQKALLSGKPVLPIFIFDSEILSELPKDDSRVHFIFQTLEYINLSLQEKGSGLMVYQGKPIEIWKSIIKEHNIAQVSYNKDYEPYARKRDLTIEKLLNDNRIEFISYKDQVIFEEGEILKKDLKPYTVFTPYSKKWFIKLEEGEYLKVHKNNWENLAKINSNITTLESYGFEASGIKVKEINFKHVDHYHDIRDFPAMDATTYLSPHLRFGTISIRELVKQLLKTSPSLLNEIIWREFFMQILFHFPKVVSHNFKAKYDAVNWRNHEGEFEKWCQGKTGYPMVDAGMRQLNETGYMHNRVRMICAGFLCKHLLIDWRWGESYFAKKLLDYELSSNNGNWQWAAGTGCDAAPYFRIFNPSEQLKKFDKNLEYVRKWIPEYDDFSYPEPMVEHKIARERALAAYKLIL
ncbi:deoxyribodipyrimidine photo-lyase [Lentimicrobium sp. S6]|uniref:cryptochrome/photolyase family protein n=1 Tax=Lentimicrobium sp. S6 TaxID=2735872 RepID=UPI0015545013|nr:deoxyribodipyrimidine photo-lyase [Lentimicrobium sp. S6]NPD48222.1 deoxyribodipyrimidine photo-lyase [Lentimicrobium sp. S6]